VKHKINHHLLLTLRRILSNGVALSLLGGAEDVIMADEYPKWGMRIVFSPSRSSKDWRARQYPRKSDRLESSARPSAIRVAARWDATPTASPVHGLRRSFPCWATIAVLGLLSAPARGFE